MQTRASSGANTTPNGSLVDCGCPVRSYTIENMFIKKVNQTFGQHILIFFDTSYWLDLDCGSYIVYSPFWRLLGDCSVCNPSVEVDLFVGGNSPEG